MKRLFADGLVLEPLTVAHADSMFPLLSDPELYRYLDDSPPADLELLRQRYARLERRESPDGRQGWLNWVLRPTGGTPIGYVQATVLGDGSAWVAYLLSRAHRSRGHASRATAAMLDHLESAYDVRRAIAIVEFDNLRSTRLLERLGFRPATPDETAQHETTDTERIYVRALR